MEIYFRQKTSMRVKVWGLFDLLVKNTNKGESWVRLSLHPVMTNEELIFILDAIEQIARHSERWLKHYRYDVHTNEYYPLLQNHPVAEQVNKWFELK